MDAGTFWRISELTRWREGLALLRLMFVALGCRHVCIIPVSTALETLGLNRLDAAHFGECEA